MAVTWCTHTPGAGVVGRGATAAGALLVIHYGGLRPTVGKPPRARVCAVSFHAIFDEENLCVSCVISPLHVARVFFCFASHPRELELVLRRARCARELLFFGLYVYRYQSLVSPQFDPQSLPPHSGRAVESADSAQLEIPALFMATLPL